MNGTQSRHRRRRVVSRPVSWNHCRTIIHSVAVSLVPYVYLREDNMTRYSSCPGNFFVRSRCVSSVKLDTVAVMSDVSVMYRTVQYVDRVTYVPSKYDAARTSESRIVVTARSIG